jgi:hypothetical protein
MLREMLSRPDTDELLLGHEVLIEVVTFLLGLFLDPDDGGDMFLGYIG